MASAATAAAEHQNIWIAASDGDLELVRKLLDEGVNVNAKDENGYNPLYVRRPRAEVSTFARN